jgi:hypothetical protein
MHALSGNGNHWKIISVYFCGENYVWFSFKNMLFSYCQNKKITKGTKILEDTQGDSSYGGIMTLA